MKFIIFTKTYFKKMVAQEKELRYNRDEKQGFGP